MITRRDLFVATLAAGTTAIVLLTPWQAFVGQTGSPSEASGLGAAFDALLLELDGTHGAGRAYIDSQTPAPSAATLTERLRTRLGSGLTDRSTIEARLGEAVKADFSAGRTCRVDGWLLSETECELAGLRWQLHADRRSGEVAPAAAAAATTTATADGAPTIVEVTNWGPQSTEQGSKFNVQPDGHSGLWFLASDTPSWVKLRIDGEEAPTTVNERGFTSGLFGAMQDRILSTPGNYALELYDPMRDIVQRIGDLEVRPFAERALLADGSRSTVFCPVTSWGPEETTAGVAANAQPDGSQGMWFQLPCAPNNVQLVFGDDRLPATRTDRGVTCRVPLALLESAQTVTLKLRHETSGEEMVVGQFTIQP